MSPEEALEAGRKYMADLRRVLGVQQQDLDRVEKELQNLSKKALSVAQLHQVLIENLVTRVGELEIKLEIAENR